MKTEVTEEITETIEEPKKIEDKEDNEKKEATEHKIEEKAKEKTDKTDADKRELDRQKRFRIYRKSIFTTLIVGAAAIIIIFIFGIVVKHNNGPVGYWTITEASSGELVMKDEDARAMGLNEIGAFKINKGGDCVITYLGKDAEGTWKQAKSGKIAIKYGEEKKIVAVIDKETGEMTAKDNESMVYKLKK